MIVGRYLFQNTVTTHDDDLARFCCGMGNTRCVWGI
jgi:hypothetical protein